MSAKGTTDDLVVICLMAVSHISKRKATFLRLNGYHRLFNLYYMKPEHMSRP